MLPCLTFWRRFLVLLPVLLIGAGGAWGAQQAPQERANDAAANPGGAAATEVPNLGKRFWESSAERMAGVLARLGNYSCIIHLDRYERSRRMPLLRKVDSVRLQVTSFGGAEYYSLPGKSRTVTNPRELISTGLVATGIFQGYARTIFVDRGLSRLEFLGADETGPRLPLRYRFQLDPTKHPLDIRVGTRGARVPGQGVFWIDQADLRLRRIMIENALPIRQLGVRRALYVMDWAPVRTAAGQFLLPQRAEMRMEMEDGSVSRNEATMAQCREYRAESEIRFEGAEMDAVAGEGPPDAVSTGAGEPEPPEDGAGDQVRLVDASSLLRTATEGNAIEGNAIEIAPSLFLPGGLALTLRLTEPLDLANAAVGDEFRASVTAAIRHNGQVLVPAGAETLGRVRRLSPPSEAGGSSVAWLEFTLVRAEDKEYLFLGHLTGHARLAGIAEDQKETNRGQGESAVPVPRYRDFGEQEATGPSIPGVVRLSFSAALGVLPAGFTMDWKTVPAAP